MIPKIIHYTWFSDDPYPDKIKECMNSWKAHMPDYQFIHWDLKKIKDIKAPFLKEAIEEKKWAFASDYVRLYAVFHYGGIYLDTDVKVIHGFNELLDQDFFIGKEHSWHLNGHSTVSYLSSHCFGAVKGHQFLKDTLTFYDNSHFVRCSDAAVPNELRLNMILEPYVQAIFAKKYGYNWNYSANFIQHLKNGITIYPSECFDATNAKFSAKKYCIHLATGSWREDIMYNPKPTLKFKFEWRFVAFIKYFLSKFGYTTIKLT